MKKIIGWALDLLFGPAGEDYVSRTSIEQSRLESMSLEELQREMNDARAVRAQAIEMLEVFEMSPRQLAELQNISMCRSCGPVCICGGRRRS